MPEEIADSDADSNLSSPRRPAYSPINHEDIDTRYLDPSQPDLVLDLPFSQFLSPTQRLSSFVKEQEDGMPEHSTASTDSFLREFEQSRTSIFDSRISGSETPTGTMDGKSTAVRQKRRFSDIENGLMDHTPPDGSKGKTSKRSKTYGSSRSHNPDDISRFFTGAGEPSTRGRNHTSSASGHHTVSGYDGTTSDTDQAYQLQPSGPASHDHNARQRGKAMNVLQKSYGNVSALQSSISGYQGINIDFRNTSGGLDVNSNPFGTLSQNSVEDGTDVTAVQRPDQLTKEAVIPSETMVQFPGADSSLLVQEDLLKQFETSPLENASVEQTNMQHRQQESIREETVTSNDGTGSSLSKHSDPRSDLAGREQNYLSIGDDGDNEPQPETIDLTTPKKRGRKPKKKRTSSKSAVAIPDDDVDELQQNTPDAATGGKKALKLKGTCEQLQAESSPAKNLSSELQLSDDFYAKYPKEKYNPRPSRSRSKQVTEDVEDEQSQHSSQATSHPHSTEPTLLETTALDPPRTSKKQGKKSKAKRAKTSAATMKHSAAVHDEGEDTAGIKTSPAEVQIASATDTHQLKREDEDIGHDDLDQSEMQDDDQSIKGFDTKAKAKAKAISVNIPTMARPGDEVKPKPEPKKRGRKPKRAAEVLVDAGDNKPPPGMEQSEGEESHDRPALAEKDANISVLSPRDALEKANAPTGESNNVNGDDDQDEQENEMKPETQQPDHSTTTTTTNPISKSINPASLSTSTSSTTTLFNPRARIGLSKRLRIPSLLRKLDRTKEPPKLVEKKEKLTKKQKEAEEKRLLELEDGDDDAGNGRWNDRGTDGMLIEWND